MYINSLIKINPLPSQAGNGEERIQVEALKFRYPLLWEASLLGQLEFRLDFMRELMENYSFSFV